MTSTEIAPTPQAPTEAATSTLPAMAHRPRRLRRTEGLRRMVREHHLTPADLIYLVFVMAGTGQKEAIPSMPGCYRYTLDLLLDEVAAAHDLGIPGIALFPLIAPELKDNAGTESYNPEGLVPQAVRAIKQAIPNLLVFTDVALDPYSSAGHDGIVEGADIMMVKPALAYMDIIHRIKQHTTLPVAAYNVSGEYAMVKAAAQQGWIDEQTVVMETLTSLKR